MNYLQITTAYYVVIGVIVLGGLLVAGLRKE